MAREPAAARGEGGDHGGGKGGKRPTRDVPVHLVPTIEFVHGNLTEPMCHQVFGDVRTTERERKWTLFALARFWIGVVITAPPSLTQALEDAGRKVGNTTSTGLLPYVDSSAEAFFQKSKRLSSSFFEALYSHFVEKIRAAAPSCYAQHLAHLRKRFTDILVIDGSRLDAIARRLRILWNERGVILPGCLTAVYDIFRGFADRLWFYGDAAMSEFKRATVAIGSLAPGSLLIGDRLYSSLKIFDCLKDQGCHGLFRWAKNLKLTKVKKLSSHRGEGWKLDDYLVEAGTGRRLLRMIVLKVGVGTGDCSPAPPSELDVQFSRIQLSKALVPSSGSGAYRSGSKIAWRS